MTTRERDRSREDRIKEIDKKFEKNAEVGVLLDSHRLKREEDRLKKLEEDRLKRLKELERKEAFRKDIESFLFLKLPLLCIPMFIGCLIYVFYVDESLPKYASISLAKYEVEYKVPEGARKLTEYRDYENAKTVMVYDYYGDSHTVELTHKIHYNGLPDWENVKGIRYN